MNIFSEKPLPRGYSFAKPSDINADEAVSLFRASELMPSHPSDYTTLQEWDELIQESIEVVGVRDRDKILVGIGFLTGDLKQGALANLSVHPRHRHQGLGRAIVSERIRIADKLDIPKIDTLLIPTNNLRQFYVELGFTAVDTMNFTRQK